MLHAQEEVKTMKELKQIARTAWRSGDRDTFISHVAEAKKRSPNNERLHFNYAMGLSDKGEQALAMVSLQHLASMGLSYDVANIPFFKNLKQDIGYPALLKAFEQNLAVKGSSEIAFRLQQQDFFPEGIAYDAKTKRFFIGSIHHRKIIAYNQEAKLFADETQGLWSVMGMTVDADRRRLWVTTTALAETKNVKESDHFRTAVVVFDLDKGTVLKKFELSNETGPHHFGDVILDKKGNAYINDGRAGSIYLVPENLESLTEYFKDERFTSMQGLVFSEGEDLLYIADWAEGIFVMNVAKKEMSLLKAPANIAYGGVDGLYLFDQKLIAIQNGTTPHRIMAWTLNNAGTEIVDQEILAANLPEFDEPTLGLIQQGTFYYVGNSQWGRYDKTRKPLPIEQLKAPVIFKRKLR